METVLDICALLVFLLVVPSVVWAVRSEQKEVSAALAGFVAVFATIFGLVFMSAASQLATSRSSTQIILLVFMIVIALLARFVWASKPAV